MYASLFNRKEIANKLLEKGENPNERDLNGVSAIEVAKKQYNQKMVELLSRSNRGNLK